MQKLTQYTIVRSGALWGGERAQQLFHKRGQALGAKKAQELAARAAQAFRSFYQEHGLDIIWEPGIAKVYAAHGIPLPANLEYYRDRLLGDLFERAQETILLAPRRQAKVPLSQVVLLDLYDGPLAYAGLETASWVLEKARQRADDVFLGQKVSIRLIWQDGLIYEFAYPFSQPDSVSPQHIKKTIEEQLTRIIYSSNPHVSDNLRTKASMLLQKYEFGPSQNLLNDNTVPYKLKQLHSEQSQGQV